MENCGNHFVVSLTYVASRRKGTVPLILYPRIVANLLKIRHIRPQAQAYPRRPSAATTWWISSRAPVSSEA